MAPTSTDHRTRTLIRTERPRLHKVILVNDDYTPREFVVAVLKLVFRLNEAQAAAKMLVAHQKGACMIAVYTREVAETKAQEGVEAARQNDFPLMFTTEPED